MDLVWVEAVLCNFILLIEDLADLIHHFELHSVCFNGDHSYYHGWREEIRYLLQDSYHLFRLTFINLNHLSMAIYEHTFMIS